MLSVYFILFYQSQNCCKVSSVYIQPIIASLIQKGAWLIETNVIEDISSDRITRLATDQFSVILPGPILLT